MQNKGQIQQLLAIAGASPRKQLGQNFLIDQNLIRLLVDTADVCASDLVLEVGPGTGSLTEALAEKAGYVIAVEIDNILAGIVTSQLSDKQNAAVINADILKTKHIINPAVTEAVEAERKRHPGRFLLVANLPYNIASPLMINLVTERPAADAMFVTIQKEVAQRMVAQPANKHYGTLSILLWAMGHIKMIRTLKPSVFWPQPQVDSAMVAYTRDKSKVEAIRSIPTLAKIVNTFMQHRRKTIHSCTRFLPDEFPGINFNEIFAICEIDPESRPDQITPEQYVEMANLCHNYLRCQPKP